MTAHRGSSHGPAGAQELDQDALADGRIVVDPSAAHERIAAYLAAHDVNGDITITAETVTGTAHPQAGLQLLHPATTDIHHAAPLPAPQGRPSWRGSRAPFSPASPWRPW